MQSSNHDFGKDIMPRMVEEEMNVFAYPYGGYWIDVGTIDAYWEAHMDLLASPPSLNLNDRTWVIHTLSEERPPVQIHSGATINDSMITDGSVITEGAMVERRCCRRASIVGPNAVVRESIILTDTYIEAGAVVERCIIDKIVVIGQTRTSAESGCGRTGDHLRRQKHACSGRLHRRAQRILRHRFATRRLRAVYRQNRPQRR